MRSIKPSLRIEMRKQRLLVKRMHIDTSARFAEELSAFTALCIRLIWRMRITAK